MSATSLLKATVLSRDKLYTTTPCHSKRYHGNQTPAEPVREWELVHATGLSTCCSAPVYIGSRGWQSYTHPEGKRYYSRDLAPRIIVEVDLMDDAASAATDAWADLILGWAAELDLNFGPSVELFVDPEVDMGICDYYFVDHATRAVFWLEDAKTSELGMLPACSDQHMKLALQENYWRHVEMFCMHLEDLPGALEELIAIYLHGRADLATSSTSTFYFTPEVTDVHLDILMKCRSIPRNPMIFSFIGRLWGYMVNARFQNFYGEAHCRLDRTTHVFAHERQQLGLTLRCASAVMFGLPHEICVQLDEQLVDGLVIEKVWSELIASQTAEWKTIMQWTFALIISSALALPMSPVPTLAHVSLVLSTSALLLGVLLQQHLKRLTKDVDDACSFLSGQKGNMMPLAIVFTLPRAAFIWALVLFTIQASCILFCAVPFDLGIFFGIVLLAIALGIWRILNPSHNIVYTPTIAQIPILSLFRRGEKVKDAESSI